MRALTNHRAALGFRILKAEPDRILHRRNGELQVDGIDSANRLGGMPRMRYSRAARPAVVGTLLVGLAVAGIVVLAREPRVTRVMRGPDFARNPDTPDHLDSFGAAACVTFSRSMTDFGAGLMTYREFLAQIQEVHRLAQLSTAIAVREASRIALEQLTLGTPAASIQGVLTAACGPPRATGPGRSGSATPPR